MDPLIFWVVYTPIIIDGDGSGNHLGGLHRIIIESHGSVNYFGGVDPQNN